MDDKKYQVFVSSTYKDLHKARKKVIEAILSIYHFPVGMEMFSADDSEQWEIIKETIDASDYYVVIIGHRYGVLTTDDISYTEREYRYAKEIGVPVLAFIRSRNIALTDDEREGDPEAQKKLNNFISLAQESKMCDFWETPDELVTKVAIALPKVFKRTPRVGWIRSSEGVTKKISQELAELSNENRKLRDKVAVLEASAKKDLPKIDVNLFSISPIHLKIVHPYVPLEQPEPFRKSDIPESLKMYSKSSDIDEYNEKIPDAKAIAVFNARANLHHQLNNKLVINPKIKNTGATVATSVYVEIVFPDFVWVVKKSDESSILKPDSIVPESPIDKADDRRKHGVLTDGMLRRNFDLVSGLASRSKSIPIFENALLERSSYVKVNARLVNIFENKLLHTMAVNVSPLTLIPIRVGSGMISVSVICEEFKEKEYYEFPITVS